MKKYIIAGGGVAAFEAARAIRELDSEAEITIYSRENILPYRRPALPRALAADLPENQFLIKPAAFYRDQRITVKLGVEVAAIDRANRRIRLGGGETAGCDALLLALGGTCFRPPVPGIDGENTAVLRDWRDALHLRQSIASGKRRIALIGGGLLGLELADALLHCGCQVTVIEGCPRLLPRQLDEADSAGLLETVQKISGLAVELGRCPQEVTRDGVLLAGGVFIPADLVAVSAGMRPECAIAAVAGLEVSSAGIIVDDYLRTSENWIYAAGDCAAMHGAPAPGLYASARSSGAAAGRNMAGANAVYSPACAPASMKALGVKLFDGKLSK